MQKDLKVLLSIPARNEEKMIATVISESLTQIRKTIPEAQIETLVVSDGSTDNTALVAQQAGATVHIHTSNIGLGAAFQEAVTYALEHHFDIMLTIDGDGQFSALDIEHLLRPILTRDADFVTGSRFNEKSTLKGIPTIKRWGNYAMSLLISSILGQKYRDVSCGFRAYSREALLHLNLFAKFTYTQEVFLNLGRKNIRIIEVPIHVQYFSERRSRIAHNVWRYGWRTFIIIIKSVIYYRPIMLFGMISILLEIISTPPLIILGIRYIITDTISPFKGIAITCLLLFLTAGISMAIGLILQTISKVQLGLEQILYYERKRQ